MKRPCCPVYCRLARLLFAACVSVVLPALAEAPSGAHENLNAREQFVELDSEIQAIKQEILAIDQEIQLLEGTSLASHGEQLVVLVSVAAGSTATPSQITLLMDGETLSQHSYSDGETAALLEGGVHRLFAGGLAAGNHQLEVLLFGRLDTDKEFQQRGSLTLSKRSGRQYVELELRAGDRKSGPDLSIRELQQ